MKSSEVTHGRIAGIKFAKHSGDEVCFVVWNQWRSGAKSLFSKYLAENLLSNQKVSAVYCLDRIASGGMSDNNLIKTELKNMQNKADLQFKEEYSEAVIKLTKKYKNVIIVGSSGGTLAVQACVDGLQKTSKKEKYRAVMIEPTGLRPNGIKGNTYTSLVHGFSRHVFAYRHRVGRGWWTPMDREQYFSKGAMLEKRGIYFASGKSLNDLSELIDKNHLDLDIYISDDSHMHSARERKILKDLGTKHTRIHVIHGNHDKICQPVPLAKLYLKRIK